MDIIDLLFWYLLIVNIIAFVAYGVDKYKAKRGKWRIQESTLIWMGFIGGCIGACLGMFAFRHKTKHVKFLILVPLSVIVWACLLWYLWFA